MEEKKKSESMLYTWHKIPGFFGYEFCNETLMVKSVERKVRHWRGGLKIIREKILKLNQNNQGYYQYCLTGDNGRKVLMRSQICWVANGNTLPHKGIDIDHKNNDKTDDRFCNLQILTHRANTSKRSLSNGKTLPTGVTWDKKLNKYKSSIYINKQRKHLGYYNSISGASTAYQTMLVNI